MARWLVAIGLVLVAAVLLWPFLIAERRMTRIVTTIRIDRPVEAVFDYVTTPANWPKWHPATVSVSGAAGHSLLPGEEVVEEFRSAGWPGRAIWRVTKREAPHLWQIETASQVIKPAIEGGSATIVYRLAAEGGATRFERDFTYQMPNPWLALLDRLVIRRRIEWESSVALEAVKEILEASVHEARG
jgi:uncharacterized protein YndB with AHSA1/START domain